MLSNRLVSRSDEEKKRRRNKPTDAEWARYIQVPCGVDQKWAERGRGGNTHSITIITKKIKTQRWDSSVLFFFFSFKFPSFSFVFEIILIRWLCLRLLLFFNLKPQFPRRRLNRFGAKFLNRFLYLSLCPLSADKSRKVDFIYFC